MESNNFTSTVTIPLKEYLELKKDSNALKISKGANIDYHENHDSSIIISSNFNAKIVGINLSFNRYNIPKGGMITIIKEE